MPAILEVFTITDSGDNCRRSFWANATNPGNTLANFALAEDCFNLPIEVFDLFVELQKEGMQRTNYIARELGDIDPWIGDNLWYRSLGNRS